MSPLLPEALWYLAQAKFGYLVSDIVCWHATFNRQFIYAQPFIAAVDYRNFKKLLPPDGFEYVDTTVYTGVPESNWTSFNSNIVLRWEYHPGSTLFLVWTQARYDDAYVGDFKLRRGWDNLFGTVPNNTFLIKVNYRWNI